MAPSSAPGARGPRRRPGGRGSRRGRSDASRSCRLPALRHYVTVDHDGGADRDLARRAPALRRLVQRHGRSPPRHPRSGPYERSWPHQQRTRAPKHSARAALGPSGRSAREGDRWGDEGHAMDGPWRALALMLARAARRPPPARRLGARASAGPSTSALTRCRPRSRWSSAAVLEGEVAARHRDPEGLHGFRDGPRRPLWFNPPSASSRPPVSALLAVPADGRRRTVEQRGRGARPATPCDDLHLVVQAGVDAQVVERPAGAGVGVGGPEHDRARPGPPPARRRTSGTAPA